MASHDARTRLRGILAILAILWIGLIDRQLPLHGQGARSADGVWQRVQPRAEADAAPRVAIAGPFAIVRFDRAAFETRLAPRARIGATGDIADVVITLPMPDGSFQGFRVVESPILSPELARDFPEIKTYSGQGIDDPSATARFGWTEAGFHSIVLSETGTVRTDPYRSGTTDEYVVFYKGDTHPHPAGFRCTLAEAAVPQAARTLNTFPLSHGGTLRTYRLAIAATAEYTAKAGGTKSLALARIVATINTVNGIFERDLSIRLQLKTGTTADSTRLIYTDSATDPFTNDATNAATLLTENQATLDVELGSGGYDIGHLFGTIATSSGGQAQIAAVCLAGSKGKGVTRSANPVGDAFDVDYVAHEIGHQFGGSHTFNGSSVSCGNSHRSASHAYEVGSGSTIQAYAGTCDGENLQLRSNDYFHVESLNEITAFVTNGGNACAQVTSTGNTPPVVTAGMSHTIPYGTPFALTASGTDVNGHALTYAWEQYDLGPASSEGTIGIDLGSGPLFRSYPPVSNPTRVFPSLTYILNHANAPPFAYGCADASCVPGEGLPWSNRTMNFRVTVRDNASGGGAIHTGSAQVQVTTSAGPFRVTAPNTGLTWVPGATQNVTWNAAGTSAGPVSTANVRITLSLDGGYTFPVVLAESTPNDGSHAITVPNQSSALARVKVEAVGNIFFDLSDVNFHVGSGAQHIPHPEGGFFSEFGYAIAVDGTRAIVGMPHTPQSGSDTNRGAAYIYERVSGVWTKSAKLQPSDTGNIRFGDSVAIAGDVAVIGAPLYRANSLENSGAAYVFVRSGGSWIQRARLLPATPVQFERFGMSVAAEGSRVVVGAPHKNAMYVFLWNGATYGVEQRIDASTFVSTTADFGASIAIDSDRILVGAPRGGVSTLSGQYSGRAWVYTRSGGSWARSLGIAPSEFNAGDQFGASVDIEGDRILVGAPGRSGGVGAAYVFRSGAPWSSWLQVARFTGPPKTSLLADGAQFGTAVSLFGPAGLIGAPGFSGSVPERGALYVIGFANGQWWEVNRMQVAGTERFGSALAMGASGILAADNPVVLASQVFALGLPAIPANSPASLTPSSWAAPPAGGTQVINVSGLDTGTAWAVSSHADWLHLTGTSATSAVVLADPNATSSARVGTMTIAGQVLTVSQAVATGSFAVSPTTWSAPAAGGSQAVSISSTVAGAQWTAGSTASWLTVSASTGSASTVTLTAAPNSSGSTRSATATIGGQSVTVVQAGGGTFGVSPSTLRFAATNTAGVLSPLTPAQTVTVTAPSAGQVSWSVSVNQPWVQISPASGAGTGTFTVGIVNPSNILGSSNSAAATVMLTPVDATVAPLTVTVQLTLSQPAALRPPIGGFDTPANGSTNVVGAIAVTGWALDDVGVERVEIWRNCLTPIDLNRTGVCRNATPSGLPDRVFVGNAAFVPGARTDIETNPLYVGYPQAYRAGWGYLLLTNALPNQSTGAAEGGQGAVTLYAYAIDREGRYTEIGSKAITLNNDNATVPFGAIDTPEQGGTVTAALSANFGWAMTRRRNASGVDVPKCIERSRYRVFIDGVPRTLMPGTNWFPGLSRADLTTAYPGLCDSANSLAAYYIDVTALGLASGLHTIGWDVYDDNGTTGTQADDNVAGIGSRFFNILVGADAPVRSLSAVAVAKADAECGVRGAEAEPSALCDKPARRGAAADITALPATESRSLRARVGPIDAPVVAVAGDAGGRHAVNLPQGSRLTVDLGGAVERGYLVVGDELRDLPIGSTLDGANGHLYWQPAIPYFGAFELVFVSTTDRGGEARTTLEVRITDPTAGGDPEVTITSPRAGANPNPVITVTGTARDPRALTAPGISAVHVWAYRKDVAGVPTQFLGEAVLEGSTYTMTTAPLQPGTYDIAVFAWVARTGTWAPAATVTIAVR